MVLVVSSDASIDVIKHLEAQGEKAWLIGEIVQNDSAHYLPPTPCLRHN
jgi:phosphoribosylformylglycinamidine cyclo-ligase